MGNQARPLEYDFTPAVIDDDRLRASIRSSLRQVMLDCGVFCDDPVRAEELLTLTDTYQKYSCPAGADEESLTIGGLYGIIIILHGTGILTGSHLELTPNELVRCVCTGTTEGDEPPESARLLAELGRRLRARNASEDASSLFVHYAARSYRAYRDRRAALLRGTRPASLAEYEGNRAFRIGIYPWVWLWIALRELLPPARMLQDQRLRRMLALANQITYMRNDVATHRRDAHDGIENYVFYLEADLGCDREHAIEIVKERCNDKVSELLELGRAVAASPDGHEVGPYTAFLESVLVGNLLALDAFASTRYVEMDTLAK